MYSKIRKYRKEIKEIKPIKPQEIKLITENDDNDLQLMENQLKLLSSNNKLQQLSISDPKNILLNEKVKQPEILQNQPNQPSQPIQAIAKLKIGKIIPEKLNDEIKLQDLLKILVEKVDEYEQYLPDLTISVEKQEIIKDLIDIENQEINIKSKYIKNKIDFITKLINEFHEYEAAKLSNDLLNVAENIKVKIKNTIYDFINNTYITLMALYKTLYESTKNKDIILYNNLLSQKVNSYVNKKITSLEELLKNSLNNSDKLLALEKQLTTKITSIENEINEHKTKINTLIGGKHPEILSKNIDNSDEENKEEEEDEDYIGNIDVNNEECPPCRCPTCGEEKKKEIKDEKDEKEKSTSFESYSDENDENDENDEDVTYSGKSNFDAIYDLKL